jgi:hypothetical protein
MAERQARGRARVWQQADAASHAGHMAGSGGPSGLRLAASALGRAAKGAGYTGLLTPAQARLLSGKLSARSLVSLRVAGGPRRSIELTMSMPGSEKRSAKSGCNRVSDRIDDAHVIAR